jgi:hypothetical protein
MKNVVLVPMGGLGNMIFQFLFAFSISKKNDANLYICYEYNDKRDNIKTYRKIFEGFAKFVNRDEIKNMEHPFHEYKEPVFKYHELPDFSFCKGGTLIINGYFQSWKYSENSIDDFVKYFHTTNEENYNFNPLTVCIHVRRGDYIQQQNIYPLMTEEYYRRAMSEFDDSYTFLVFSEFQDDMEYRNWNIWKEYKNVKFIEGLNPLETLYKMSSCEHFIIPNSTLSLCAYYLRYNKNAKLFAPGNWFGPEGPEFDIRELIPHNSHTLILYPTN